MHRTGRLTQAVLLDVQGLQEVTAATLTECRGVRAGGVGVAARDHSCRALEHNALHARQSSQAQLWGR